MQNFQMSPEKGEAKDVCCGSFKITFIKCFERQTTENPAGNDDQPRFNDEELTATYITDSERLTIKALNLVFTFFLRLFNLLLDDSADSEAKKSMRQPQITGCHQRNYEPSLDDITKWTQAQIKKCGTRAEPCGTPLPVCASTTKTDCVLCQYWT